jgi:hypothetical protein
VSYCGALPSHGSRPPPSPIPLAFLSLFDQLGLVGHYPEELILQALRQACDQCDAAVTLLMDGQMPPPSTGAVDQPLAEFPRADPGFVRDGIVGAQRDLNATRRLLAQLHRR